METTFFIFYICSVILICYTRECYIKSKFEEEIRNMECNTSGCNIEKEKNAARLEVINLYIECFNRHQKIELVNEEFIDKINKKGWSKIEKIYK